MEPATNPKEEVVSLNYCSQNGGNLYRAPYYDGNPNIGSRIIGNLDQSHPIPRKLQSLSLKGPIAILLLSFLTMSFKRARSKGGRGLGFRVWGLGESLGSIREDWNIPPRGHGNFEQLPPVLLGSCLPRS